MSTGDEVSPTAGTNPVEALREFVRERDWAQFHSPENLAKSISIEAAELLECFQWSSDFDPERFQWSSDFDPERVQGELADVLTYCHLLADRLGLDANQIVLDKLAVTRSKYPVAKAYGRSDKYDEL